MPVLFAAVAVLGLAVGSFLNVVIHRVPAGESIVSPSSCCPGCNTAIRLRHNVPLISWLMLRGRCADCDMRISPRYPAVEVATGGLFVLTTLDVARLGLLPALPAYLVFVTAGVALTVIDCTVMRLPNSITYPTAAAVAVLLGIASIIEGSYEPFARAISGGLLLAVGFLVIALAKPGGMGLGDVKLAGIIGMILGFLSYPALLVGTAAAFVLGTALGVVVIALRRSKDRHLVPFGPAMIAGALVAMFATAPLIDVYRSVALTT